MTLDNASVNASICNVIQASHKRRELEEWDAAKQQLPYVHGLLILSDRTDSYIRCLGHVLNLSNAAIMSHITTLAAAEASKAIWEFDPTLPSNSVLHGNLDVIASIRTIAAKIQASPQRVEYFEKLQHQLGIEPALKIPLHSNVRGGSAFNMVDRAYQLREVSRDLPAIFSPLLRF